MANKKVIEKMKKRAIEDGNPPITLEEFSNKLPSFLEKMEQKNYEGYNECWNSTLMEHNSTLSLIYGLVIGIFSAVFIQSMFEILKITIKKEFYFFIFTFLVIISFFILTLISSMLLKTIRQMRDYTKKCEENMKESLKRRKEITEELKKKNWNF